MSTPPDPGDGPSTTAARPRRDALVAELGREVRAVRAEIRRELARIDGMLAESADLLAGVLPRVGDLAGDLAELAGRVEALAGAVAGEPGAVAAVDWPGLDAVAAAAEWEALAEWVASTLGPWYELTRGELPDCWAWHRPAVIELVWLRRCYVAAHAPGARPGASAEWHTRWRRDALAGVAAAIPDAWCRPGEHRVHRSDSESYRASATPHGPDDRGIPRPAEIAGRALAPPPRGGPRGGPRIAATSQTTSPDHWERHYRAASAADLEWRRQRAATLAEHAAADPTTPSPT